jgi:hypothetical protein
MKKFLLLLSAVAASAVTASATPILVGSETSLQSIINSNVVGTSINVNTNQVANDSYWTGDSSSAAFLIIELAGYAPNNAFGIYQTGSPVNKHQVFAGSVNGPSGQIALAVPTTWSSFGFYIQNTSAGYTWYSDPALNGGLDHFVAFQGAAGAHMGPSLGNASFDANDYILGIEDLNLGDKDYNDMVVLVQNVNRVPDAGMTLAFLGLGIAGLCLLRVVSARSEPAAPKVVRV